jgi:hypothetical protein
MGVDGRCCAAANAALSTALADDLGLAPVWFDVSVLTAAMSVAGRMKPDV